MGRYTKAYSGTLALVCAGSITVAVRANERAAKLDEFEARAARWETWATNERGRDARAFARYSEVARRYRQLAREVGRSRLRLQREIAATRSLHRSVVAGAPIVTYVRVRKLVPVVTPPAGAAPGSSTTTGTTTGTRSGAKQSPSTATKPKKPGTKAAPGTPGTKSGGGVGTGTPGAPGAPGDGTGPGTTTAPPAVNPPGAPPPPPTAPPAVAAPVNSVLPSIIGQPQSGKTFSADPGSWTGNPTSFQYQWQRCDASGASCVVVGSAQTYTCVPQDIDKTMRVAVEAKNAAGSAIAVSAASPKTKPS